MNETARLRYLKIALVLIGTFCTVGVYPLTVFWPSGWAWHAEGHSLYLQMIIGIYATLGVFLIIAARNPLDHLSLIWFAVWSSIVHGGSWRSRHSCILNIEGISSATFRCCS